MIFCFRHIKILFVIFLFVVTGCKQEDKFFTTLSSSETGITFENNLPERAGLNILYYLYYYAGGGVATGDINNDGLVDIYFTANSKGNNKLYLNQGDLKFEDITQKAAVAGSADWCSGVTMADINADGWLDIYVSAVSKKSGLQGRNELFINNKNGSFTESAVAYGLDIASYSCQSAFFDYDNDGDLDCYILNQSDRPFQNIVDTSNRRKYDPLSGDRLLRNDMDSATKKFTDVSARAGIYQSNLGYGLGLAIADINNDGWDDIYIGNDFHENDYYYVNNGNGTFTESGEKHFRHYSRFSMGNDVADFNNDGQLDIVTADMLPDDEKVLKTYGSDENPDIYQFKLMRNGFQHQYSKNCLQINNGNGSSFSETSLMSGVAATDWSWSALFADFDNDGNKDLFFTSGVVKRTTDLDYVKFISDAYVRKQMDKSTSLDKEALDKMPGGISHNYLYKGNGELLFEDKSNEWGLQKDRGYFTGASYADLDNDGDLDLIVNAINDKARVYRNNKKAGNYLSLSLKGSGANTNGIGTKAWLFNKGKMQYLQTSSTRGFLSGSDIRLHFGIGDESTADSLLIVWPSKKFQLIRKPAANSHLVVEEKNAEGIFSSENYFPKQSILFEEVRINTGNWQHIENPFVDFNVQYLIPQAKSTRGPKMAVADVNDDGLDDFYVCGAKDQTGALMIQQSNGRFLQTDTALFNESINAEETDAVFFDANGDKHPDLYIVTGGNEYSGNNAALLDHLYLNDGKGNFARVAGNLPPIYQNKSCAKSADVDNDGDNDLFIGVFTNAIAYGIPQTSYLLINNGKGNFSFAPKQLIDLDNIGMVTTASFNDFNKDGRIDLLVAGEWMPLTVFINEPTGFKKQVLPNSTGWWQTVFVDDLNNDGNPDILGGNWGLNNKFSSGKNGPVKLYAADFDNNGRVDQLLSYTLHGKEYPFLAKDEVERQLPLLKKHYLYYADYAGVPMKEVFYGWVDTIQPFVAEKLASVVCFGNGTGGFELKDLPHDLQKAPVFSFEKTEKINGATAFIAGGNFYDVIPYEGRYDAQPLALFTVQHNKTITYFHRPELAAINAQVRDIKWISTPANNKNLLIAANNSALRFLKYKK
jgi:hypothetical protein